MSRLQRFLFVVIRPEGHTDAIFYASSVQAAWRMAREWAEKHGYRVELVVDEDAA